MNKNFLQLLGGNVKAGVQLTSVLERFGFDFHAENTPFRTASCCSNRNDENVLMEEEREVDEE